MLLIRKKINWPKYFTLSVLSTSISALIMFKISPGWGPQMALLSFFIATLINHLLLLEGALRMVFGEPGAKNERGYLWTPLFFLIKTGIVLVALGISIQFISTEIFIPVANYLAHIAILVHSMKRSV